MGVYTHTLHEKNRVDSHFEAMVFDVRCSNEYHPEVERK